MFKKGQRIVVEGNDIFKMMGYEVVTGTVFLVNEVTGNLSIQCDQTGCIELLDPSSGLITTLEVGEEQ